MFMERESIGLSIGLTVQAFYTFYNSYDDIQYT